MGRNVRSVKYTPMSQAKIERLMNANNVVAAETIPIAKTDQSVMINRHYEEQEYDVLQTESALKSFLDFSREVTPRYNAAIDRGAELDKETQDVLHLMELGEDMNASKGYKAYKILATIRRERRVCKNEAELLEPIVRFITDNQQTIKQLEQVLGKTRTVKQTIANRSYAMRTDAVKDII